MVHEFDGEKYARVSAHQKEWGARLIDELELRGDERVLDLGCGDGALTAELADRVPRGRVLGIDASEGMIEAARRHERGNLAFERMDINDLSFEGKFDVVFSNATLHWVKDHDALLANAYRSLVGGGGVRFNFAADGNCAHFFEVVREVMARDAYAGSFASFEWPWTMPSVGAYEALLQRFAFSRSRVWGENADRTFPDAEALIGWIDQPSLVPFLEHGEGADRGRFRDAVVERMLEETGVGDGTYFETFRRINVHAVR